MDTGAVSVHQCGASSGADTGIARCCDGWSCPALNNFADLRHLARKFGFVISGPFFPCVAVMLRILFEVSVSLAVLPVILHRIWDGIPPPAPARLAQCNRVTSGMESPSFRAARFLGFGNAQPRVILRDAQALVAPTEFKFRVTGIDQTPTTPHILEAKPGHRRMFRRPGSR
jgi:hypothetical protein